MSQKIRLGMAAMAVAIGCTALPGVAQQVTVTTPRIGVRDSFYEHINLGWGYHRTGPWGGWFMGWGGPMSAIPPFGGYDPSNDFRFGFARQGNDSGFHFNLAASTGNNRAITMDAPSVTMMNGFGGQVFSGSLRPFVTGLIPVVGDYPVVVPYAPYQPYGSPTGSPVLVSPLAERLARLPSEPGGVAGAATDADSDLVLGRETEPVPAASGSPSSAARGELSLAEIRRQNVEQDEADRLKLAALVAEGQAAERAGKLGAARAYYRQAAAKATGKQRTELLHRAEQLKPRK